jgi:hypothetical protein
VVDTPKEEFGCWIFFSHFSPYIWQGLRGLFTSVQAGIESWVGSIMTPEELKRGGDSPLGIPLKIN